MFTAITMSSLISDYALASLLSLLLEHGQFGITFAGMEQGLNLGDLFGEVQDGKRTLASLKIEGCQISTFCGKVFFCKFFLFCILAKYFFCLIYIHLEIQVLI